METTDGEITIELFADKSPITVENFLRYVEDGHYDGTVFHRVISNFMIQGGGFTAELEGEADSGPIVNESINKLHNTRGTLAMARTSDPDSASAQFFINQRSNLQIGLVRGQGWLYRIWRSRRRHAGGRYYFAIGYRHGASTDDARANQLSGCADQTRRDSLYQPTEPVIQLSINLNKIALITKFTGYPATRPLRIRRSRAERGGSRRHGSPATGSTAYPC